MDSQPRWPPGYPIPPYPYRGERQRSFLQLIRKEVLQLVGDSMGGGYLLRVLNHGLTIHPIVGLYGDDVSAPLDRNRMTDDAMEGDLRAISTDSSPGGTSDPGIRGEVNFNLNRTMMTTEFVP